ncbi:MAG: DUF1501 domain-containing protein [Actinomycetota bacterium]
MLRVASGRTSTNCAGATRRSLLQAGFLGAAGLSLADVLRLRAAAATSRKPAKNTACILIWLDGGPSQLETYDPKPEAPDEVRGPFKSVETSVKGIRFSELLSRQAKWAHRMAVVPSVHHDNGDHFAAAHWMLTGRYGATGADQAQRFPSVGSYVSRLRGSNREDLPAYVGVPAAESVYLYPGYQGASYLGAQYDPFQADWDRKYIGATAKTKIVTPPMFKASTDKLRLSRRATLLDKLDLLDRRVDRDGSIATLDRYSQQAVNLLLNPTVREAFDLDAEPAKVVERYGDSPWCRYTLLARRLVERGVTFVTVDMPHWDDHDNIAASIKPKCETMDRAVASLIQDLDERGMLDQVLVVVMGEFGRTPKLNKGLPALGRHVPGRDHWGNAISVMFAGGGLRMGQMVGSTNAHAEHPQELPFTPEDVLATIYHVLGIDPRTEFLDREARPIPILSRGEAIRQLI